MVRCRSRNSCEFRYEEAQHSTLNSQPSMKRPWQVWCVFLLCVLGAAAAMVWLSQQALRTDERRRAAEAETELEQEVSLALWRMDSELAPIIAAEVIRPPSAYRANAAHDSAQMPNASPQQQAAAIGDSDRGSGAAGVRAIAIRGPAGRQLAFNVRRCPIERRRHGWRNFRGRLPGRNYWPFARACRCRVWTTWVGTWWRKVGEVGGGDEPAGECVSVLRGESVGRARGEAGK